MNARPFLDFLREQRKGDLHAELTAKLQELVAAVDAFGRPGSLSLTVSIRPSGNVHGTVVVDDKVVVKAPQPTPGASIFWITAEHNLVRNDPDQPTLDLREVRPQSREPKPVPGPNEARPPAPAAAAS